MKMALSVEEYYVAALIVMAIDLMTVIIVALVSLVKLYILDSSWIDKTYRNLTFITICAFTMCSTGDFIRMLIRSLNFPYKLEISTYEVSLESYTEGLFI